MTALIALYSPYPRSGKGEFASELVRRVPGTIVLKFAQPIRDIAISVVSPFLEGGEAEAREWLEDERKDNKMIPILGATIRHVMQTLGLEWGRKMINSDIWVLHARERLRQVRSWRGPLVVVDDLRFPNEHALFRKEGATLIRIERPDAPMTASHGSNAQLEELPFDYRVTNEGLDGLRENAQAIAKQLGL